MSDRSIGDEQRLHWKSTFAAHPKMYGDLPSEPAQYAVELFAGEGAQDLLELGAGQGRDTLAFLTSGFRVTALDFEEDSLRALHDTAETLGVTERLRVVTHDVRDPLPGADATFDAVYSHMLFSMALSTVQLETLADEVRRVLRPGGLNVYTVRHVGDAHFGAGIPHGDGMFENGGFIVHFFDRPLVDRLAAGFTIVEVHEFDEGELPRQLWRITARKR